MLLLWLLAAVACASPLQPPVKAAQSSPLRQRLQGPGVIFATINETETLRSSLEKLLPQRSSVELSAMGAVYYRPPASGPFVRLGSALWPSNSEQRASVQDAIVEQGGELRVHSEPKRYPSCELSLESWANRTQQHGDFLVVDKPPGVPCAPHVSNGREWLVPFVAAALAASRKRRFQFQAKDQSQEDKTELVPCNRLDVQTSGLVVLAETKDAARHFQQLLLDGKVRKRYRALVRGQVFRANQILEHKISDSVFGRPAPRLIASMDTDDGVHKWRDARATILSVETRNQIQELEIELHTGRTHQLRAQLAALGSPVIDDSLYQTLSGFMWKHASDDVSAGHLVKAARTNDAPIGLQCSQLEFDDEVSYAGDPWWRGMRSSVT